MKTVKGICDSSHKRQAKQKIYPDGQFVALEQRQCIVCGKLYETGNLFMDKQMRNVFENRYALTGFGLCPEHQKYADEGYVICLEVNNQPRENGETMRPEDADRTGDMCFIKKKIAREIFNTPIESSVIYCEVGVIGKLKDMVKESLKKVEIAEDGGSSESAV